MARNRSKLTRNHSQSIAVNQPNSHIDIGRIDDSVLRVGVNIPNSNFNDIAKRTNQEINPSGIYVNRENVQLIRH